MSYEQCREIRQGGLADTSNLAGKCQIDNKRACRIKKYIAVLDSEKLNQGFIVFCKVKMQHLNYDIARSFSEVIARIPEVTECYNISGSFDYLLKIHAPDMKYYQSFILNVLGRIDEFYTECAWQD